MINFEEMLQELRQGHNNVGETKVDKLTLDIKFKRLLYSNQVRILNKYSNDWLVFNFTSTEDINVVIFKHEQNGK